MAWLRDFATLAWHVMLNTANKSNNKQQTTISNSSNNNNKQLGSDLCRVEAVCMYFGAPSGSAATPDNNNNNNGNF